MNSVRVYSYIIDHDLGFAPNPFHGVCTLAACKPKIRKIAQVGDYVVGTGGAKAKLQGYLSYWMRVSEILTFEQFWSDTRYFHKRPLMRGSRVQRYGDNIYHRDSSTGNYIQEDSFHSAPGGVLSRGNLERDTGTTDRVLIGNEFAYWGQTGPKIPDNLKTFVARSRSHRSRFTDGEIKQLLAWLQKVPARGYLGEPPHWRIDDLRQAKRASKRK